ncbi:hypothetical protein EVAR_46236_1 [Eumeta japonica]|uniref:Uncharacterized protein n=1 Tax=Eumeta variegata TaxID=151549 RepID=A0A4C1XN90_EUMVA|nr:hypothetical protein EVAR_46236_1 [Eumeta japonica]
MNDDELISRRKKQNVDRVRAYRKRKKDLGAMPSTSTVQSGYPSPTPHKELRYKTAGINYQKGFFSESSWVSATRDFTESREYYNHTQLSVQRVNVKKVASCKRALAVKLRIRRFIDLFGGMRCGAGWAGDASLACRCAIDGPTKGIKKPVSKGNRLVIAYAGGEAGFVPNALLTFKVDTKSDDYHDNMISENYDRWFRTKLIPNL